jgi:hypothetical protein
MSDTELQSLVNTEVGFSKPLLLLFYRRVLDHLFDGGNIFYANVIHDRYKDGTIANTVHNTGRLEAYNIVALIASNLRRAQ